VIFAGILAAVTRWFFHFWAGVVFWGSYAPEGMNPYLYSFIFNGASAAANAVMLAVVLVILLRTARTLFVPKDTRI
jgi:thiamine transporter